jgi:Zn-dependent protease with chaperone function
VIGHEFSHILNGDMRLNIHLMGLLDGILGVTVSAASALRANSSMNHDFLSMTQRRIPTVGDSLGAKFR